MHLMSAADFGKLITQTRKASKLTQAALAAAVRYRNTLYRDLENGKPTCELEKALLVAAMLGIKLEAQTPPLSNAQSGQKS